MGLKIGIVGAGAFSPSFIKLFKVHPMVDSVELAELIPKRRSESAKKYKIKNVYESLDEMLKESEVDAVGIFTQRHLHGPQVLKALENGKHVYSAVPIAIDIEDIQKIVEKVKETGLTYMTGETSYYYPATIFCRDKFNNGDMGDFVYGEAQYHHDMLHFYESYKRSGGDNWKDTVVPPMYYPTHSVSMMLSVTGQRVTKVSCMGYREMHEDKIYRKGANWDNEFSNETAVMRTSDGGVCRINEMRRIGYYGSTSVYMSLYGTKASFEQNAAGSAFVYLDGKKPNNVTELLKCKKLSVNKNKLPKDLSKMHTDEFYFQGMSQVHNTDRLPDEFVGMHNGHLGSHQFLVDDFVKSVLYNKLPPNNVWAAARYALPGLIAHKSALKDGIPLKVPDFGYPKNFKTTLYKERNVNNEKNNI